MPRFYFHLVGPDGHSRDLDGIDFLTFEDAFLDAHRAVLDMSCDMLRRSCDPSRFRFDVCDDAGKPLFELPFTEVLRPSYASRSPATPMLIERLQANMERSRVLKIDIAARMADALRTVQTMKALLGTSRESPVSHASKEG